MALQMWNALTWAPFAYIRSKSCSINLGLTPFATLSCCTLDRSFIQAISWLFLESTRIFCMWNASAMRGMETRGEQES